MECNAHEPAPASKSASVALRWGRGEGPPKVRGEEEPEELTGYAGKASHFQIFFPIGVFGRLHTQRVSFVFPLILQRCFLLGLIIGSINSIGRTFVALFRRPRT